MNTGVVRSRYNKADLDKAIKEYREQALPAISAHEGGRSGMLLVNRETGDVLSIGFYDSEAAAKSFAPKAEKLIGSFEKYSAGAAKPARELYEIATSSQQEARAIVERGMKAFNARDLEQLARDAAPDAEYSAPGDMKFKGPQAIKEYNQGWIDAFPDARVETRPGLGPGTGLVYSSPRMETQKLSFEDFKNIIVERLGCEPEQVTMDASFQEDLNADSLDLVELIYAFEENTGLEIPDEDAEKITTVGQAWEYIQEKAGS